MSVYTEEKNRCTTKTQTIIVDHLLISGVHCDLLFISDHLHVKKNKHVLLCVINYFRSTYIKHA